MGRKELPVDPASGPIERFAEDLRLLRRAAGMPTYAALARRAHYSVTALSQAAAGKSLPTLELTLAYVRACGGDIGGWVDRWHRVSGEQSTSTSPTADAPKDKSPYRGLVSYQPDDAPWFFGREKLITRLLERLRSERFLAVFGPSGSGKSSVVRAGLIPGMHSESAQSGPPPAVALFTPGDRPIANLLARLREYSSGAPPVIQSDDTDPLAMLAPDLLVVVDQFEELYTLGAGADEQTEFIDALLAIAADPDSRARVVICVRAEFLGACATHAGLVTALQDRQQLVGPMSADELYSAIVGPATRAGLTVDAGLVGRAVADAVQGGGAGALPLLSHVLLQTWRRHTGSALTLADYDAAGGLSGAIARTADEVFGDCDPAEQNRVKRAFVRLTAGGHGSEATRRRMSRGALVVATGITVEVLDRLVAERLLTTDEAGVEIAHEALIREWPALRDWLDEDRDGLRQYHALTAATDNWVRLDHDDGMLWRGARLSAAGDWVDTSNPGLTDEERAFLRASTERDERELAATQLSNRRLRRLAVALAATVVLVLTAGGLALSQRQAAVDAGDLATAQRLAVQAELLADQHPLSLLLALQSQRIAPNDGADAALLAGVLDPRRNSVGLVGHRSTVYAVALTPDGATLFTGGEDRDIRRWDARSGALLGVVNSRHTDPITDLVVTADGSMLVSSSDDTMIRRWDVRTGEPIGPPMEGKGGHVKQLALTPAGLVVSASLDDRAVHRWDVRTGLPVGPPLGGQVGEVWSVAASPDGSVIVSAGDGGIVRTWDAVSGRPIATSEPGSGARVRALAVTSDGVVLAGSEDGGLRRLDLRTGARLGESIVAHPAGVLAVTVGRDGTAVTAGRDGDSQRWDVATGAALGSRLVGHDDQVTDVAVSTDGSRIVTGSRDRTVRLWNLDRARPIGPTVPNADQVARLGVSADHAQLGWAGKDGALRRWDMRRNAPVGGPSVGHQDEIRAIGYSSDGSMIITGAEDNTVRRWVAATGAALGPPLVGHSEEVARLALSPDDAVIVSGGFDGTVRRWDARTGAPIGDPLVGDGADVDALAVTPDGSTVIAVLFDRIWRWDIRTGALVGAPLTRPEGHIEGMAVSRDGSMIAAAGADRRIHRWDARTGRALGAPGSGHEARVIRVAFDEAAQIVSVDESGVVRHWDGTTGAPVGRPLANYGDYVYRMALTSDGSLLGGATRDGRLQVFPADAGQWREYGCRIVGRNLTAAEWRDYLGADTPYERTCPDLLAGLGAPPE